MAVREQELFCIVPSRYPRGAPGLPTAAAMWLSIQGREGGGKARPADECNVEAFLHTAAMNSHFLVLIMMIVLEIDVIFFFNVIFYC